MEVLKVQDLTYTFPGQDNPVFENLSFSLEEGEFILLSGESGSGKSTLLNCLNGVIPQLWKGEMRGEVRVGGLDTKRAPWKELVQKVGTLWQDVESQLTQFSVEDELLFGLENIGLSLEESGRRLEKIYPLVGLQGDRPLQGLSGGQKQRLALGALLAMLPRVILLDEPLANLDYPGAHRILGFLRGLCRGGKTVLMVEHRLDLSASYVDRLLYLEQGKLVMDLRDRAQIMQEEGRRAGYPGDGGGRGRDGEKEKTPGELSLEIEGLWASYGRQGAWAGLDLALEQGDRLVLLGENGGGKSTFLKILGGVKKGLKTGYRLFNLLGLPVKKIRKPFYSSNLGLVLQNPNHQLFMQSVYKEVALNAPDSGEAQKILGLFGLEKMAHRHPLSLSQGQKRLLAVAAAVVHHPSILLLDEPTIGQDYRSLQKMVEVLNYLNRERGMTVITATHDRQAAERLGNRVLLFQGGTVKTINDGEGFLQYWGGYANSGNGQVKNRP